MTRKPKPKSEQPPRVPSFGSFLRGHRMGYGWCVHLQAHLRLSFIEEDGREIILAELAPNNQIPARTSGNKFHHCWWDGDERDLLKACPALRAIKAVKAPFVMRIDPKTGRHLPSRSVR